jgi:hypothetical protein
MQRSGGDPVTLLGGLWRVLLQLGWMNGLMLVAFVGPWLVTTNGSPWPGKPLRRRAAESRKR